MSEMETANLFLGILAIVSLLEFVLILGALYMGYRAYSRLGARVEEFERRRVGPLMQQAQGIMTQAQGIMTDVHGITTQVGERTEAVADSVRDTAQRFEHGAHRVRHGVRRQVVPIVAAYRTFVDTLRSGDRHATNGGGSQHGPAEYPARDLVEDRAPGQPPDYKVASAARATGGRGRTAPGGPASYAVSPSEASRVPVAAAPAAVSANAPAEPLRTSASDVRTQNARYGDDFEGADLESSRLSKREGADEA